MILGLTAFMALVARHPISRQRMLKKELSVLGLSVSAVNAPERPQSPA
jgi:hypothetical protein